MVIFYVIFESILIVLNFTPVWWRFLKFIRILIQGYCMECRSLKPCQSHPNNFKQGMNSSQRLCKSKRSVRNLSNNDYLTRRFMSLFRVNSTRLVSYKFQELYFLHVVENKIPAPHPEESSRYIPVNDRWWVPVVLKIFYWQKVTKAIFFFSKKHR